MNYDEIELERAYGDIAFSPDGFADTLAHIMRDQENIAAVDADNTLSAASNAEDLESGELLYIIMCSENYASIDAARKELMKRINKADEEYCKKVAAARLNSMMGNPLQSLGGLSIRSAS